MHANGVCTGDTYEYLKGLTGKKLVDYIEHLGEQAFLITDLYKPLDLKNKSAVDEGFKKWENFTTCFKSWFKNTNPKYYEQFYQLGAWSSYKYLLIDSDDAFDTIKTNYLMLNDKNKLGQIKNNLNTSIKKLAETLEHTYDSLTELSSKNMQEKLPEAVADEYKIATGITFDPITFLTEYKKSKLYIEKVKNKNKKSSEISPEEVFGILKNVMHVIDYKISTQIPELEANRQQAITTFINMIEELIYQSNRINKARRFWHTKPKPKYLLSSSQIRDMEEIVAKLYALYPAIITESLEQRLNSSDKYDILFFAQARMMMIVLRSYLRTVNALLQNK